MSKIKDYGEPWSYNKDRTPSLDRTRPAYQDRDGKTIPGKSTYADDGAVRDRALACVNALAGRDPEKLEGLLEAVRDYVNRQPAERPDRDDYDMSKDGWKYGSDLEAWLTAQSLKPALAAFEGGEK